MKEMLNVKELGDYLGINEKQVYRLIKDRKIPATKITGKWLFPKVLIDECLINSARERVCVAPNESISTNDVVIARTKDPNPE